MDPVSLALMALSAAGGIMSASGGRRVIDPEALKRLFGPEAVTAELTEMFNRVINSAQGQQLLTNAAQQASQYENNMNARAGAAGFGGDAESGASIFSKAASGGAGQSMERNVRGSIMSDLAPLAQQNISDRMHAYLNGYYNTPTTQQTIGGAIGNAAGTALMARAANPPGGGADKVQPFGGPSSIGGVDMSPPPPGPGGNTWGPMPLNNSNALQRPGIFRRAMGGFRSFGNMVTPGRPFGRY